MDDRISFAFWNLCNYYEPGSSARGPQSEREIELKRGVLARTLGLLFDGKGPDIFACAEVNSERLVKELGEHAWSGRYSVVWEGSQQVTDAGIGLLWDATKVLGPDSVEVYPANRGARLRYVLLHMRVRANGMPFLLIINHWKSRMKLGGVDDEADRRDTAEALGDRLGGEDKITDAILVGDFNAEPFEAPFGQTRLRSSRHFSTPLRWRRSPAHLYNPMWRWLDEPDHYEEAIADDYRQPRPTTSFGPDGNCIFDQLLVSGGLLRGDSLQLQERSVCLYHDDLIARYTARTGRIVPIKWEYDPEAKTSTGCSDHLPLLASFIAKG
ncbi:MAG: hypothetical protein ABFE08_08680 [Armatimonadia bacterium]